MPPGDLEDVVDRALRRLPVPQAPRTLAPRVMAAIAARTAPAASARPWLSWPLAWQVASVAAIVVFGIAVARLAPGAVQAMPHYAGFSVLADVTTFVGDGVRTAAAAANATRIVWHAFGQPLIGYVLVLVFVMCAACVTFGAALGRLTLGGVSQT